MQLQRITTSTRWMPEIDGLRFVAILSVLLVHIFDQTLNYFAGGPAAGEAQHRFLSYEIRLLGRGVQLFFVISGFILAQPFVRQFIDGGKPVALGKFYLRRLTRLEPPYLLSLVLYAAAFVLFRHETVRSMLTSFGVSAVYGTQVMHGRVKVLNFVTWSLEVEVQFYLLTPLLARIFQLRRALLRRSVLIGCILLSALPPWWQILGFASMLPYELCFFMVGFLLADLRVASRPERMHPLWDLVTLLIWPVYFFTRDARYINAYMCVLLAVGFTAAMFGPLTRRALAWKPIAIIGGACYSIYLLHMLIISALFPLTRRLAFFHDSVAQFAWETILLLPCIVGFSMVYFIAVERPCMDPEWPRHLWHRLKGRAPSAALTME